MQGAIVIQARTGSTRLPGKVLLPALGRPLLELMLERLTFSRHRLPIVLATTVEENDNILARFALERHVPVYRGSEHDVLDRYHRAAVAHGLDFVVRLTSDCPLIDPRVVDRVLDLFLSGSYDFVSTNHPATFPDGLDTEVFRCAAAAIAWKEASLPHEREHVTPFIWDRPERFRIGNVEHEEDLSQRERWTLDYEEDYFFIKAVFEQLYVPGTVFHLEDVLGLLDAKPELRRLNDRHLGTNWYAKHWDDLATKETLRTRR